MLHSVLHSGFRVKVKYNIEACELFRLSHHMQSFVSADFHKIFLSIFKGEMGVCIHGYCDLRMAHNILQILRIHP